MRVDVFEDATGCMVVNEFESLDASYCSTTQWEMTTRTFLTKYWENKIVDLLIR
jgi:hypothetical protein